jgi:hypothetical protein
MRLLLEHETNRAERKFDANISVQRLLAGVEGKMATPMGVQLTRAILDFDVRSSSMQPRCSRATTSPRLISTLSPH